MARAGARARARAGRCPRSHQRVDEGARHRSRRASGARGAHRRSRISTRGTPAPARDGDCARDCEEPEDSGQKTATPNSTQAQEASHAKKTSTIETDPTPPSEEEDPWTTSVKSLRYCASKRISRLP